MIMSLIDRTIVTLSYSSKNSTSIMILSFLKLILIPTVPMAFFVPPIPLIGQWLVGFIEGFRTKSVQYA